MDNAYWGASPRTLVSVTPTELLQPLLSAQDGAMTTAQALSVGLTRNQLRTLTANGWSQPSRGVYICPEPRDPFRSGLRGMLLLYPNAVACRFTAARIHRLWGLPRWTPAELPELLLPSPIVKAQPKGARLHFGLHLADRVMREGLPVASLALTVKDT